MVRLKDSDRVRVVLLKSEGFKFREIRQIFLQEGIKVHKRTLERIYSKFKLNGLLADLKRKKKTVKLNKEHKDLIDNLYKINDELTAFDIQKIFLKNYDLDVSLSTIKSCCRKLGWKKSGPKYCQVVRERNRVKRLEFAAKCLRECDKFEDVIFTDESSIWLEKHAKLCFRKYNEPPKLKAKAKHRFKVHVWAGISRRGKTGLLIFTGIMEKNYFVHEILEK